MPATKEFNEDPSVQKFIKDFTLTLQRGGDGGSNPGDRMWCPQMSVGLQRRAGAHVNAYEGLATICRAL